MTEQNTDHPALEESFSPGIVRVYQIEQEDSFGEPVKFLKLGEFTGVYLNSGPEGGILTVSDGEREIFSGVQYRSDVSDGLFTYDCFRADESESGVWGKYRIEYFFRREDPERAAPEREDQTHD